MSFDSRLDGAARPLLLSLKYARIVLMEGKTLRNLAIMMLLVLTVALALIFTLTDPVTAGLGGILSVMLLIYLLITTLVFVGLYVANQLRRKSLKNIAKPKTPNGQLLLLAFAVALLPVLLLAFNSLGSIGAVELFLVVAIEAVTIFFIWRGTKR